MIAPSLPPGPQGLPNEVHGELWRRVDTRLERGDALVTPRDYLVALEADFGAITGDAMSNTLRRGLATSVAASHRERPERYQAVGLQNSVRRAFQEGCLQLGWDVVKIRDAGPRAIARFKSQDRVRELFSRIGVRPSAIDEWTCVEHAIQVVSGVREPMQKRDPAEPLVGAPPALGVVSGDGAVVEPQAVGRDLSGGGDDSLTEEEVRSGAFIGRVETRVAGTMRLVPRKLMRSPEDPDRYVIAQRNPLTRELEPLQRRGATRPVTRGANGTWQLVGGS